MTWPEKEKCKNKILREIEIEWNVILKWVENGEEKVACDTERKEWSSRSKEKQRQSINEANRTITTILTEEKSSNNKLDKRQ